MSISVSIASYPTGQNLAGKVTVSAVAKPIPLRYEFFLDGALKQTGSASWLWDTATAVDGSHVVRAEAVYKTRRSKAQISVTVLNNVAPPPPPTPPTGIPLYGISMSTTIWGRTSAAQDAELDRCKEVGARYLRYENWPGYTAQDAYAVKVAARGMESMIDVWNPAPTDGISPAQVADFAVQCLARTRLINVFNEPDLRVWSPEAYAPYLKAVYQAVKAANPDALVIGFSLSKFGQYDGSGTVNYLQRVKTANGGLPYCDAIDIHLYDNPLENSNHTWNLWEWLPDIKLVFPGVPIICTEAGGPVPKYSEAYQATIIGNGLDARLAGTIASYGQFSMSNDASPGGFGMLRDDKTLRPSFPVFQSKAV